MQPAVRTPANARPPRTSGGDPVTTSNERDRVVAELSVMIAGLENLRRRASGLILSLAVDLDRDSSVTTIAAQLHATCIERKHPVTGDGWTNEKAAADLIGIAPSTLRGWRDYDTPLTFRKLHSGGVQYSLIGLANYLSGLPKNGAETR